MGGKTLREVGEVLGVSRERARQIEKRTLRIIRFIYLYPDRAREKWVDPLKSAELKRIAKEGEAVRVVPPPPVDDRTGEGARGR